MRGGIGEFNRPIKDLGEVHEPGPGEWEVTARQIVTMGRGTLAVLDHIAETLAADAPPDEPAKRADFDAQVITFPIKPKPPELLDEPDLEQSA